jgi:hypothetical protein
VTRVRRQAATSDLENQTKATVSKVKAATTTARTSATRTSRAAKSAGTSAKRTAGAAKKAAEATADKIGDRDTPTAGTTAIRTDATLARGATG